MIFNTIQELKTYAGGQVNVGVSLEALTPAYNAARENHLERYLGEDFLDYLELKSGPAPGDAPTAFELEAIQLVSASLALLTLYEWSFTSSVQHSTEGMMRAESDMMKGAYKYQVNDYRSWSLNSGLGALDIALRYCEKNAAELPLWNDSDAAAYHRAVLIRDTRTLRAVHNQPGSRAAYEALRPLMYDLQEFIFVELLGREQLYRQLEVNPAVVFTAEEKALTQMLQRSLAAFAVYEGLSRNVVQIDGGRIIQSEALEPQSMQKTSNPTATMINISALQNQEFAERHLSGIRNFLTLNSAAFPLYTAWLDTNQPDPEEIYPLTKRPTGRKVVGL